MISIDNGNKKERKNCAAAIQYVVMSADRPVRKSVRNLKCSGNLQGPLFKWTTGASPSHPYHNPKQENKITAWKLLWMSPRRLRR
jgi:hypothetical protein